MSESQIPRAMGRLLTFASQMELALRKIEHVCCMNIVAAEPIWCKPDEGKHSIYCAAGIAAAALIEPSAGAPEKEEPKR